MPIIITFVLPYAFYKFNTRVTAIVKGRIRWLVDTEPRKRSDKTAIQFVKKLWSTSTKSYTTFLLNYTIDFAYVASQFIFTTLHTQAVFIFDLRV